MEMFSGINMNRYSDKREVIDKVEVEEINVFSSTFMSGVSREL